VQPVLSAWAFGHGPPLRGRGEPIADLALARVTGGANAGLGRRFSAVLLLNLNFCAILAQKVLSDPEDEVIFLDEEHLLSLLVCDAAGEAVVRGPCLLLSLGPGPLRHRPFLGLGSICVLSLSLGLLLELGLARL
jgi:hypothetical protein